MIYAVILAPFGAALCALAIATGGYLGLALGWLGITFLAVGVIYAVGAHRIFGKRADGTVGPAWWAFLPFLAPKFGVYQVLRRFTGERVSDEIAPGLFVGRRPRSDEIPIGVSLVVDLCGELPASRGVTTACEYLSVPTLDTTPPTQPELARAVAAVLAAKGSVLVHCTAGRSRSAMVTLLAAVQRGTWPDMETAERAARAIRPSIRLTPAQRRAAQQYLSAR